MLRSTLFTALVALLSACGTDGNNVANNASANPNNTTANNTTANNTTANNTTANNTTANNTTANNTTANNTNANNTTPTNNTTPINNTNPGVEVAEIEPNDDEAMATRFAPNDTLVGNTGAMDNDYFAIDLVGGSVLEVELTTVQLVGSMYVDLVDPTGTLPERTAGGDEGDRRQFFIPVSGRYVLRLTDLTAGVSNYQITTRVLPPNPVGGYAVPGSTDGDLDDYDIDIYTYRAAADGNVRAGVTADRSPVLSEMDALLIVYDPAAGLVVANDDVDAMTVDPEVTYEQRSGRPYWIVVDAVYLATGGDNSYALASELQ